MLPATPDPNVPHALPFTRSRFRNVEIVGGGFVTGIVLHPREQGLMVARTDVGGAYRWDTDAQRWAPITDWIGGSRWAYTGVESVALDPNDPDRVYLALGIYNQPRFGKGVVARSRDRGRSWELTELPLGMGGNEAGRGCGERLAVDPNCSSRLLFGSRDRGLWKSEDHGASWARIASFPEIETALPNPTPERWNYLTQAVGVVFVLFDPESSAKGAPSQHILAGVSTQGTSLFESHDAGESWSPVPGQPKGLRPIRAVLATNGTLYLTYGREPGPNTMFDGAVFKFSSKTKVWSTITPLAPRPEAEQPFGYAGIAVDATDPERLLVATAYRDHARDSGGDELFLSLDGGETYTAIGQRAERDCARAPWLAFRRGSAHLGHWIYALALDPFDSNRAYYGTGQTIWGTANLGRAAHGERTDWAVAAVGIEETVPLSWASPPEGAAVVVGTGDISGFAVFDVDDVRRHAALCQPTFKDTSSLDFAELSPSLWVRVGSRGWNRELDLDTAAFSLDGARTWRAFPSTPHASAQLGQVAVSADGASWLWHPRDSALFVTADQGRTWRACEGIAEGQFALLSDRVEPERFYAFELAGTRAYRSDDGGGSFRPCARPLPAQGLSDARAVFASAGELWLVLDGALFRTNDHGDSWRGVPVPGRARFVGFGRAERGGSSATVFVTAEFDAVQLFLRSGDRGLNWTRLNDGEQQFGQIRGITGDPKRFGRFYVGTGGRGLLYADPEEAAS